MLDVLDSLETWRQRGEQIAIATVIDTWGSAPRPVGSKMAVTEEGGLAGSVSAGCVEGAVIEACRDVMQSGQPRLLRFGVADEDAWEVGLTCGGTIQVFAEPFTAWGSIYDSLKQHLQRHEPLAVVGVLKGELGYLHRKLIVLFDGRTEGDLYIPGRQAEIVRAALDRLEQEVGGIVELQDGPTLFIETYPSPPRLIIIGAVHLAEYLVSLAATLGFDTVVVDPRGAFATRERFPHVTELVQQWPQRILPEMVLNRSAYVVTLTHDPKLDDPALQIALASDARYVGALGSRRTNEQRLKRLRAAGLSEAQLARLHAPIGLPLGGRSAPEIALSIMAEIVQVRNTTPVKSQAG